LQTDKVQHLRAVAASSGWDAHAATTPAAAFGASADGDVGHEGAACDDDEGSVGSATSCRYA
jgi:hypothetical protein